MATTMPMQNKILSASVTSTLDVKRLKYGSGYTQRVAMGFNPALEEMTIQWINLSKADMQSLYNTLVATKGVSLLGYQPDKATAVQYWSLATINSGEQRVSRTWNLTASFNREFDPNP